MPCGILIVASLLAAGPDASASGPRDVTVRGEAVLLVEVLADRAIPADRPTVEGQVVIRCDDGQVVPLLSDPASRALFLDGRLRDRRVEVQGRRFEGLPFVQVTSFRVEDGGMMRTPEYYCDVCTIRVRYPQSCPCCQGSMELRMAPEAP